MKTLKWILGVLGVLVGLVVGAAVFLMSRGEDRFEQNWNVTVDMVDPVYDDLNVRAGQYIAESHGCQGCHGYNYEGAVMADAPPFLMVAPNLTSGRGGIGAEYRDEDWLRAIRHGIRPDGRGLLIMPSEAYYYMNDEETAALVAYLRDLPPVDNELPDTELRPLGKLIMGVTEDMSAAPALMPSRARVTGVTRGANAGWGEYRASVLCMVCHGQNLQGAQPPDPASPFAPDLRSVPGWGLDGFLEFWRTGENPSGRASDADFMPWDKMANLGETELEAIYRFIETI